MGRDPYWVDRCVCPGGSWVAAMNIPVMQKSKNWWRKIELERIIQYVDCFSREQNLITLKGLPELEAKFQASYLGGTNCWTVRTWQARFGMLLLVGWLVGLCVLACQDLVHSNVIWKVGFLVFCSCQLGRGKVNEPQLCLLNQFWMCGPGSNISKHCYQSYIG